MESGPKKPVEGSDEWIEPFALQQYLAACGEDIDLEDAVALLDDNVILSGSLEDFEGTTVEE